MKVAIISDIHSNLQALQLVLDDIKQFNVDGIYNLGDTVGYGAEPNEVIQLLIGNNVKSVMGNHDDALVSSHFAFEFTREAKMQLFQNKAILNNLSLKYLTELPDSICENNMRFVHGMPPDDFSQYINYCSTQDIIESFRQFKEQIAFVGHSHRFKIYQLRSGCLEIVPFVNDIHKLHHKRTIINVGSAGQPRDEDERPGYLIFDQKQNQIIKRRLSFN